MPNEASSPSDHFLLPDWLLGSASLVQRNVKTTAKAWALEYRAHGTFPEPTLVAPGDKKIILYGSSDYATREVAARFFANGNLVTLIKEALAFQGVESLVVDYENHVGSAPWGSFENSFFERAPNSLSNLVRRYSRLLPHLGLLSTVSVVDVNQVKRDAAAVLERGHATTLSNWGALPQGPLQARVATALEAMRNATSESIRERIVASMVALAPKMDRLRHPEKFTEASVRRSVESLDAESYESLTGCHDGSLRSEIYAMDRE